MSFSATLIPSFFHQNRNGRSAGIANLRGLSAWIEKGNLQWSGRRERSEVFRSASASLSVEATAEDGMLMERIGSLSQVAAVLGCQWGDEGKGKLVDILAEHFDVVARCQVKYDGFYECFPPYLLHFVPYMNMMFALGSTPSRFFVKWFSFL